MVILHPSGAAQGEACTFHSSCAGGAPCEIQYTEVTQSDGTKVLEPQLDGQLVRWCSTVCHLRWTSTKC